MTLYKNHKSKVFPALVYFVLSFVMLKASQALAQIPLQVADNHIIIIQADPEFVWGSYYFAISNANSTEETFSTEVMLPKESLDFQAGLELTPEQLHLDQQGHLHIRRSFPPGLTLVGINFKTAIDPMGHSQLTFHLRAPIERLSIATTKQSPMKLKSSHLVSGLPPMLSSENYLGILGHSLPADTVVSVEITDLPYGKQPIWLIIAIFLSLLLVIAAILTMRTKPQEIDAHQDLTLGENLC